MKDGDLAGARTAFEKCQELGLGVPEGEECGRSLALMK
jgi:type IV pilus assembly protein PilF